MFSNSLRKKKGRKRLKKVLYTSFLAVLLAFSTTAYGLLGTSDNNDNVAYAESLADVNLLQGVDVDADLGNVDGDGPYTLDLKLSGTGLADVELVNPDKTVIFYAEELASTGKWHPNGKAYVEAKLLPVALEDIPGLASSLNSLGTTLNGSVNTILDLLDDSVLELLEELEILGDGEQDELVQIKGKDELLGLVGNLGGLLLDRLTNALNDVTVYKDDLEVIVGEHGELTVDFSDALGTRLEGIVNDVVLGLVTEITDAVRALNIEVNVSGLTEKITEDLLEPLPILGDLLEELLTTVNQLVDGLVDGTLNELLGEEGLLPLVISDLLDTVTVLTAGLTDQVLLLLDEVVTLQVLGPTTVELGLTVDKPVGFSGEVEVFGELVNTSNITLDLLSSFVDSDTITFNEDTPPAEEPKEPEEPEEPEKPEKPGTKLPDTATAAGAIGLSGLAALMAGLGTRFFGRRK